MKKVGFLLSVIAASTIASAATYDYEVTPLVGGVWKEGNLHLDDEFALGAEFQFNDMFESVIKPELSVLYSPGVDYKQIDADTDFLRFMANGVYDYDAHGSVVPFAKAGLGFERMSEKHFENVNSVFADVGGGVKFPITERLALKLEAIYMIKRNENRWDNNLATLAGLTFSFGAQEAAASGAAAAAVAAVAVTPEDSDGDGVPDSEDQCLETPAGVAVDATGCPLDSDGDGISDDMDKCADSPSGVEVDATGCPLDSDGDGVADYQDKCAETAEGVKVDATGCALDADGDGVLGAADKCPNTVAGASVDENGCPRMMNLALTFEFNSDKIDAASQERVKAYAKFLNENPSYKVNLVGHTDSIGSAEINQKISERRANAVRELLIADGVDASRVTAEGRGETEPIADNMYKPGRDKNRRITAELSH